MKLVFLGSPQFAVPSLHALHASSHQVAAVVTQPDKPVGRSLQVQATPVKVAAHGFGIPVVQPTTTRSPEFVEAVASFQPDILVVVAYGEILRKNLLEVPTRGAVNLHASLLPAYRGAAPIPWAILNGEKETGVTTMLMNERMDAGPILLQEKCPIEAAETAETLSRRLAGLGAPLLRRTLDLIEKNDIVPQEQDAAEMTLAPKLKKEDGWIDWNKPASRVARQVRAFNPWPGTFSTYDGIQVKFWMAHACDETAGQKPGTILRVLKRSLLVACGEGSVLEVLEVQPENRARLSASDFANGFHVRPGALFITPQPAEPRN